MGVILLRKNRAHAPQSLSLSFFHRSQKTREMTFSGLLLQYAVGFRGVRPWVATCSYLVLPVMLGEGNKSVYSGRLSIRKFTVAIYQSRALHHQASSVHIIKYFKLFKYFKWIKIQILLHFDFHGLTLWFLSVAELLKGICRDKYRAPSDL